MFLFSRVEPWKDQELFHSCLMPSYLLRYNLDMAKHPLLFVLVLAGLLLPACAAAPTPVATPSEVQIDTEQQVVYAALLQKLYPAQSYVIMDTTATSPAGVGETASTLDRALKNMHDVDPNTADNFLARNDAAYPVQANMDLGSGYVLLNQAEMRQIFSQNRDGWQLFYEQFPDAAGITTISRAGFNTTLDQALVYVGTMSHWLAGAGYYVLLKKVNGTWTVDQQVMSWIS
jgi:hypothetical protein